MNILPGFIKRKKYIKSGNGVQLESQWTSAETVECADGQTVEEKLDVVSGDVNSYLLAKTFTKNLYDKSKDIVGKYIIEDDLIDNSSFTASDFINVSKCNNITMNAYGRSYDPGYNIVGVFFYDESKSYIRFADIVMSDQNGSQATSFNTSDSCYIRIHYQTSYFPTNEIMIQEGTQFTGYEPFGVKEVQVKPSDEVIDGRKGYDGTEYKSLGEAVRGQVGALSSEIDNLFDTKEIPITKEVTPIFTQGYINDEGVIATWNTQYGYTQKISVQTGDVLYVSGNTSKGLYTEKIGMRFGCAYDNDNSIKEKGWVAGINDYTVPEGVTDIVVSIDVINYKNHVIKLETTETKATLSDNAVNKQVSKMLQDHVYIKSQVLPKNILSKEQAILTNGKIELEENCISKNKYLSFGCDLSNIPTNGIIRMGHGKTTYNASYLEITPTQLIIYKYSWQKEEQKRVNHNLNIANYLRVDIKVGADNKENITIFTSGGTFTLNNIYWVGRSGPIFAECENMTLTNVKLNWFCDDYKKPIYAFGDSYFEVSGNQRWTAYLIANGFDNLLLDHYSGRSSQVAYQSFLKAIEHGTPKYCLWCMGMNNPDTEASINEDWKIATDNFIAKCEERGITPILSVLPNCRGGQVDDTDISNTRWHNHKNAYVKNSGYRYIDFYKAVGADNLNWYDGMLYSDGVHPDVLGAEAMYRQALLDFPELMEKYN